MCGRTCLTLDQNAVRCACKYQTTKQQGKTTEAKALPSKIDSDAKENDNLQIPEWRAEFNCGRKYISSHNIAPTDITPVIVAADHFADPAEEDKQLNIGEKQQSRIVVPMMWGMIPFWHKGDYRKHGLTTNNCRLEHMLESKLYRGPFRRGQRCVVLCEGFYEWQTTKSAKPSERAAYLLYTPQEDGVKIYDKSTWTPKSVNLLKMAGLFDVWEDENGDKMFSYSIITFESSKIMSWLHHRMPAILETEEQVNNWLDFKRVTDEKALEQLRPATNLKWHRVANIVNNSRNKSDQCNKPINEAVKEKHTLLAWLNVRKRREEIANSSAISDDEDSAGATANTSESEDTENPPKRPRFRDYKKAHMLATSTEETSNDSITKLESNE